MTVVTRFAPSPTGSLHLGSARTAFFNWLYARHCGGRFLLRVEDTDQQRSVQALTDQIIKDLQWMGLLWDQPYVLQSQRKERHQEVAKSLLEQGSAYHCYCTAKELEDMKELALKEKRPLMYDRRWRTTQLHQKKLDVPPVIRLKMPLSGETVIEDRVQGRIVIQNDRLDDFILVRSDGTPTYMLAVVVDDHDMEITHIIRGDDHLTNAFRQKALFQALNWPVPEMAHLPLIHAEDGTKLSKRRGAASIQEYKDQGILPEALLNTLLRLGFSHGDAEYISVQQAIEWFDFDGLGRSSARFDEKKLCSVNIHYLRQKMPEDILTLIESTLPMPSDESRQKAILILPELQKRAESLDDLIRWIPIYTKPDLTLNEPVLEPLPPDLVLSLKDLKEWTASALEEDLRAFAADHALSFSHIAKPLRFLLTGQNVSPSLFHVMEVLGKEWTLLRLLQSNALASPS